MSINRTPVTAEQNPTLVSLVVGGMFLISCATPRSQSAHTTAAGSKSTSSSVQNLKGSPESFSEQLIHILPESPAAAKDFEDTEMGGKTSRLLGRTLTDNDKRSLVALRALLVAQRELREQRLPQARELAKFVLSTEKIATEMYVAALRTLAFTQVIELSLLEAKPDTQTARDPRSEFNAFQNLQCALVCKTPGWEVIAREQPQTLSVSGYRGKILSETHFRREGLTAPNWLKAIWSQSTALPSKELTAEDGAGKKPDSALSRSLRLRNLVDNRQWQLAAALARKFLSEIRPIGTINKRQPASCAADVIYSRYVLAQNSRIQQDRKTFGVLQKELMDSLEHSKCKAEDFGFDQEQFDSFRLDARIWLARLQWEQNENASAFHTARVALSEAASINSWEHFADAAKIMVGRVGFEILNPTENIALLNTLENHSVPSESDDFSAWLQSRIGFFHFLDGNFSQSKKSFEKVITTTTDNSTRAMAFYWMGRTSLAGKETLESENSFLSAGRTDPLSIYDIFSGQILARESGRASTQAKRAFLDNWKDEYKNWMKIPDSGSIRIITSVPTQKNEQQDSLNDAEALKSFSQFDTSLETSLLLVAALRSINSQVSHDSFMQFLRDSDELPALLLRSETANLRQSFTRFNMLPSAVLPRAQQIAWLLHSIGDYANSILFVGRLRDSIGWDTDYLPFLYFIFYPRPFVNEFETAAARCSVDVDILYSVARQESLFQSAVKSPVGAVGLMQLMPSTANRVLKQLPEFQNGEKIDLTNPATNTIAGACYLRDLLSRYQNNLAHAVAAYNAGENAVDKWIARRQKIDDVPYFIEFIPFSETKTYVQRVLRNYYNIKWIYQEPKE